jgi:hypothetical protein
MRRPFISSAVKRLVFISFLLLLLMAKETTASAGVQPRFFVLTDIENEPDDAQSMIRLLGYSNQYDVEGLVVTTSIHKKNLVSPQRIRQIVRAYGKVRDNLKKHEPGFPTADFLLDRVSRFISLL